jgi:cytoskeletal protein RodZ
MPNEPKPAGAPMMRIGAQLKEAREKKPFTIDQVQKQTRIHATVLKALEDGRCDEMLTPTYVRSFLKKYADYLGLDSRQMLAEYGKARPAASSPVRLAITPRPGTGRVLGGGGLLRFAAKAAVAAIVIAVVIFTAGHLARAVKRWRAERPVAAPVRAPAVRAAAAPKKGAKDAPAKEQASKPVQAAPIPKSTPIILLMKVNQQTPVRLRVDGELIFERVLPKGTAESFTAKDRINIYVVRAEAIELTLNGRKLGSPGKGIIKNIEITRSGLKIK